MADEAFIMNPELEIELIGYMENIEFGTSDYNLYEMHFAQTGNSGISSGPVELDARVNTQGARAWLNIVDSLFVSGQITQQQLNLALSIGAGDPSVVGDVVTESDFGDPGLVATINAFMSSTNGQNIINNSVSDYLDTAGAPANSINTLMTRYEGVGGSRGLLDPGHPDFKQAITLLASWANRSGGLDGTTSRLIGMADEGVVLNSLDDLREFFSAYVYFQNNPHELTDQFWFGRAAGAASRSQTDTLWIKALSLEQCFFGGTQIQLTLGASKPIEEVEVGDRVRSYDTTGALVPGRVTRTFQNEVSHLLDVHGLKVTPGHVTLCGDGQFTGKHVPIIDILLSDGALVKEDASQIRMAINKPVGSLEDKFVKVSYALTSEDAQSGNLQSGKMRVGTLLFDKDGAPVSVLDRIRAEEMCFDPDTGLVCREGQSPEPFYFYRPLPRPEDYILRRSRESLEGILADGEWEGSPSELIAQRLRRTASARLS